MSLVVRNGSMATPAAQAFSPRANARQLYFNLARESGDSLGRIDELTRSASRAFLINRLAEAAELESDFPDDPRFLRTWLADANARAAADYRSYLDGRQRGEPRRFFSNRSHALHFLKSVAPTKLVDGAWLYGLLPLWNDHRLAPLIRIYLEELGEGVPARNHVALYRRLLERYDCQAWRQLPDDRFMQGAIQLSLAHHAHEFLPEVIGFNLGYEQLPSHLPITAYELNELDVDPYYFTLHVTIDNASTGHAQKSVQCALESLPRTGDAAAFYRRMANGFRLNDLGMGTPEAIGSFDLEQELLAVMVDKAAVGAQLHSDYCRIAGRTVSDWLSTPGQMPAFLDALKSAGWIRRGREPQESRFWRLLADEQAPMFGVFSAFEQQLIRDWIADDRPGAASKGNPSINRFRRRTPATDAPASATPSRAFDDTVRGIVAGHLSLLGGDEASSDPELQILTRQLAGITSKAEAMTTLQGFLSPANHASVAGLAATRIYTQLFAG